MEASRLAGRAAEKSDLIANPEIARALGVSMPVTLLAISTRRSNSPRFTSAMGNL